jgi:OmpA-like transmembrane domain
MNKLLVVVLAGMSVAFAGFADAAPKKRPRSANRIGAYAGALVGFSSYSGDHSDDEQALEDILEGVGVASQNLTSSTEDSDIGYQAMFGYRFHRFFAAELGLAQFGSLESTAKGDVDFDDGTGFLPTSVKSSFSAGGPMVSAIGILPLNEKFELFARLGYLFTSADLEFSARVDGESAGSGSVKGDSQNVVYGVGFAWNINQMYSIRGEFQDLNSLGEESRTGEEDLTVIGLGLIVRF